MILFTSGFPFSGKSELANKISENISDVIHINPKDFYLEGFDEAPDDARTAMAVSAWEMALDKTNKLLCSKDNNSLIILDTCCSKALAMRPLFMNAKVRGHYVFYVFVQAQTKDREARAPEVDQSYKFKYASDFSETVPILKKLSDRFMLVINNNDGGMEEIDKCVTKISKNVNKIRSG
jgi:tRNA uridine 5-carbamoylmethylation protein Kti12